MYMYGITYHDPSTGDFIAEGFETRELAEAARVEYAEQGFTDISEVLE